MPTVINEIDTLENVVGAGSRCEVITNRYQITTTGTDGSSDDWSFSILPLDKAPERTDASIGEGWIEGDYVTDPNTTGLPQGEKCGEDLAQTFISQSFGITPTSNAGARGAIETVISEGHNPLTTSLPAELEDGGTYITRYVGIDFTGGSDSDSRKYGGVMEALITLMPLLIIVGLVAFIVFVFGMGAFSRLGGKR